MPPPAPSLPVLPAGPPAPCPVTDGAPRPVTGAAPSGPGRYADAVRARRRELRGARSVLQVGPRELRHGLAVARLGASAELAATVAGLERELRDHVERTGRTAPGRQALPAHVAAGVGHLAAGLAQRWMALVLPAVRRVFVVRGLPPPVPWTPGDRPDPVVAVLARPPTVRLPDPEPPSGLRAALAGAATGGTWRLALLPAAALSAAGLPALGGRWRPLAVGVGLVLLLAGVRARRAAAERARLRVWCAAVVVAVRQAGETELTRRLLEVERLTGAALDAAVARRRAEIDAELRALAPEPEERGADP